LPEHPIVSIVTPTLNRVSLLGRTLRSVQAQTYAGIEHIVVDGGSTDGTLDLLRGAATAHDLRWISEPDRGMYDAVNKGLRMSTGEIVAYLNSDDLYFPWSVECAVEALTGDPGADLVFGDVMRVDEIRGILVPVLQPPLNARRMAAYGAWFQPTVFMRRHVFEELGGFDDAMRYVGDLDFWLRAAARFRIVRVSEFLALERRHAGMLSETGRQSMGLEGRRVRDSYRAGFWASPVGPIAGKVAWHLWSGLRWLSFVRATRRVGTGWERTIWSCRPRVGAATSVAGMLPSRGSRFRARIRWGADPRDVAKGS
jgi:GT2 family glycosyltransferase